jgi:hypothetical protein
MASTRSEEPPAPSGIALPPGVSRSRRWNWFRDNRSRHRLFRAGVFVIGLLLILVGAGLWLFSVFLSLPPVFVGLWLWSREFHWAHRLFRVFLRSARKLWSGVKSHPVRWAGLTLGGVCVAWAGYWALGHYGLLGMG